MVPDRRSLRSLVRDDVGREYTSAFSRHGFARGLQIPLSSPSNQRAQGKPGADCTRGLVCQTHSNRRTRAYRFSRNSPAFPTQWLYGLLRALPGERACLPPSLAEDSTSLTPASRRQDHTTSPYAAEPFAVENAASIASRAQRVVTMAIRPSGGHETALLIIPIFRNEKRNIFSLGTGQPKSA